MKIISFYTITIIIKIVFVQVVLCQTQVSGKLLSVDGSIIPNTIISVQQENPKDIFSAYDDVHATDDGSFSLNILEPGIYNLTFRGIYHHSLAFPVLIADQASVVINVLLFPIFFNDDRYLENDDYLEWIRVVGNFNNYDFNTGRRFTLNDNGSISAFIPVTSDTVRYQVGGLGYGRAGSTPLPLADEYNIRGRSFESVLYRNLPADSLEIRYTPGQVMPFMRHLPESEKPETFYAYGFISFENHRDRYWVEPIIIIRQLRHNRLILNEDLKGGLTLEKQIEFQEKYFAVEVDLMEVYKNDMEKILSALDEPGILIHQKAILCLAYAAVLNRIERWPVYLEHYHGMERPGEVHIESEIIMNIPELVTPVHPAWNFTYRLPLYLLEITEKNPLFIEYFLETVKHHPNEMTVGWVAQSIVTMTATDYESVEEMEVYKIIVDRYGVGDLARDAHRIFRHYNDLPD